MTETLKSVLSAFSKIRSIDELPYWQQEARKLLKENTMTDEKLKEAIDIINWFIENDETNEGDEPIHNDNWFLNGKTWNEINAYWIEGLNRARDFVKSNS